MVHKPIQALFHLPIISRIEGLILTLYNFFCKNLKKVWQLNFKKLPKIMESKGCKIFKNVKHGELICYPCETCYGKIHDIVNEDGH